MSRNPTPINGDGTSHCLLVADQGNIDTGNAQPPRPQNFSASSSAGMQCVEGIDPSQCVVPAVNRDGTSPTSTVSGGCRPPRSPRLSRPPGQHQPTRPTTAEPRRPCSPAFQNTGAARRISTGAAPGCSAEPRRLRRGSSPRASGSKISIQSTSSISGCYGRHSAAAMSNVFPFCSETLHAELWLPLPLIRPHRSRPSKMGGPNQRHLPVDFQDAGIRPCRRSRGGGASPAAICVCRRRSPAVPRPGTDHGHLAPDSATAALETAEAGHRVETGVGKLPRPVPMADFVARFQARRELITGVLMERQLGIIVPRRN